jgi:hypothetical protein
MVGILNLAVPYFSLIFIGFGCGKRQGIAGNGFAASVAVLIGTFASVVTLTPA